MDTTTIRISTKSRNVLRELAQVAGLPMQKVLEQAIEQYRRQYLLVATNAAYAQLREDATEWQSYLAEQDEWEATLSDGLEEL